jgi:hypothetical protein
MKGEPQLPLILIRYKCPRCHFVSEPGYCEKGHVPMRRIVVDPWHKKTRISVVGHTIPGR